MNIVANSSTIRSSSARANDYFATLFIQYNNSNYNLRLVLRSEASSSLYLCFETRPLQVL